MYKLYEDNGGFLHLAVLDSYGNCFYYLCDNDKAFIMDTLQALKAGGDPIADGWEGGELNPQVRYNELKQWAVATHDRVELLEDGAL